MACITLFAQPMAMATTQLVRAIRYENAFPWPQNGKAECSSLRLSWVVVTDNNGNSQLRMQWESAADC
jgi:hypothetical protein